MKRILVKKSNDMEREIWEIVKALDENKLTAIEAHKKLCDLYSIGQQRELLISLNEINTRIEEGKMLMAALAKITTESQTDKTPYEVLEQITKLKDEMYCV